MDVKIKINKHSFAYISTEFTTVILNRNNFFLEFYNNIL